MKLLVGSLSIITTLFFIIKFKSLTNIIIKILHIENTETINLLPTLGFSFLAVKIYSFLVDIYSNKIKSISLIDFFIYCVYFPTFISGPIEKYDDFVKELNKSSLQKTDWKTFQHSLPRLFWGIFKVNVIAMLLQPYALPFLSNTQLALIEKIYIGAIVYYWYEYMNFSGYSDMAISTSNIIGIKISENFNYPFMANSLTTLWKRWHITFARWLRDYIYYPLMFTLIQFFSATTKAKQILFSSLSIFITFVICGLWHGDQLGMLLFGISSGIVLGLETILIARYSDKFNKWKKQHTWAIVSTAISTRILTFHISCFTFAPVLLSREQLSIVIKGILQ
jgi:D-alanyl-lipoteichoic acid acyltransferase DltB (MBOAT superfamily)